MESHDKKTVLEQAYQAQRERDIPDLWNRIDQGFEEELKQLNAKKRVRQTRYLMLAAAAVLAIVIAVPVFMRNSKTKKSDEFVDNSVSKDIMQDTHISLQNEHSDYFEESDMDSGSSEDAACESSDDSKMDDEVLSEAVNESDSDDKTTQSGAEQDNQDYSYLLLGDDITGEVSYDDIQCILLQEVTVDGQYGRQMYVDMDSEIGEICKKLLVQYSILKWPSSDGVYDTSMMYLFGIEMKDGTIYTRIYHAEDTFGLQTYLQFVQAMFRIKE